MESFRVGFLLKNGGCILGANCNQKGLKFLKIPKIRKVLNLFKSFDIYSLTHCAPVAQLDRVSGYEPGGREFESLQARH